MGTLWISHGVIEDILWGCWGHRMGSLRTSMGTLRTSMGTLGTLYGVIEDLNGAVGDLSGVIEGIPWGHWYLNGVIEVIL